MLKELPQRRKPAPAHSIGHAFSRQQNFAIYLSGGATVENSRLSSFKDIILGKPKDPLDPKVFHQISLIAFLAWVGLGADGLSSSAYGPEEAYLALGNITCWPC